MNVTVGNRIVVAGERVDRPPRTGSIDMVLAPDPPRYRVRWDDGRTTIIAPASGAASIEGSSDERDELTNVDDGSDLCRSVNDRIRDLEGMKLREYDFVCECEDHACTQVMRMTANEYETLRSDSRQFAVLPGHEHPKHDKVLVRTDRYAVVMKRRTRGRRPGRTRA
jgi:Domain of unknown function (DUF1918)